MLPGLMPVKSPWMDSNADFLGRERFASLNRYLWARREPRELSQMDFVSPLVSRLSVVTAYVAFAFVGAIVLGVF
jgi:hypothetical protein